MKTLVVCVLGTYTVTYIVPLVWPISVRYAQEGASLASTRRNISLTATHTPSRSVITSCSCRCCDSERVRPPSLVTSARPRSNHGKCCPKHEKKRVSDVAGQVGPKRTILNSLCPSLSPSISPSSYNSPFSHSSPSPPSVI